MTPPTALPHLALLGFDLPLSAVVLGALSGLTYGLLAVGLVLIYRTSRFINFAHGQMGALGVAVLGMLVTKYHVPYYIALPPALAAGGAAAGATELVVVRRLRNVPPVMSIVATLGVGSFLSLVATALDPGVFNGQLLPSPPWMPVAHLGGLRIDRAYMAMLIFGPLAVAALTAFFRLSRFGLGIRCAAANPQAARMAGISADNMSSLAWVLAGVLSALTAVLVLPATGFASATSFGPSLLLRALTAGVLAGMANVPIAFGAGILVGVAQQLVLYNFPDSPGLADVVFVVVVLAALLFQRDARGRTEEKGSWVAVAAARPLPATVARLPEIRALRWGGVLVALAVAVLLPLTVSNATAVILTTILAFSTVGLSVGIGTGLSGQLSLGQFAIAAAGAVVALRVGSRAPFAVELICAAAAGALMSLAVGAPALRVRGIMLTVTTLGFGLLAADWGLDQPWALGHGKRPLHPVLFGRTLDTGGSFYYVALAVFLLAVAVAWNARRLGLGRALLAVRDNESNARAFTVPVQRLKIQGFVLAGAIAGLGGAVYAHSLSEVASSAFPVDASIDTVAMTVIGGVSSLLGPLVGAFYIIGLPRFVPLDAAGTAATQLGWLILVLYLPGGITQGIEPLRERYVRWAAARHGLDARAQTPEASGLARTSALAAVARPRPSDAAPGEVLLQARGLRKSFGGIAAVRDVSFSVNRGEIVGLIGPNGAGKTTTFELLSGFTRQSGGQVIYDGIDVSTMGPERRGRLGLIRSFQDATLFPTLSVADTVRLAFEPSLPTSFARSVLGVPGNERERRRRASDLLDLMGLGAYQGAQIRELSTGTRRITELACLIALSPSLLLLDEPSSGVAQRETEALGVLLRELNRELGLTMVVIEHDIPLIMGLADRVIAMDVGTVLADETPDAIQADPRVIASYLGASAAALNRSGPAAREPSLMPGPSTPWPAGHRAEQSPPQTVLEPVALPATSAGPADHGRDDTARRATT